MHAKPRSTGSRPIEGGHEDILAGLLDSAMMDEDLNPKEVFAEETAGIAILLLAGGTANLAITPPPPKSLPMS